MKKLILSLNSKFEWFYFPVITVSDVIEIILLAYVLYHIMLWFKRTRAWTLIKGIIVIVFFAGIAMLLQLNTLLWIFRNTINVGIIAVIVLFQPEIRRALEELGRKKIISDVLVRDESDKYERLSDNTIAEIVEAAVEMSRCKTGALIVIEQEVALGEYESTGIVIDAAVSRQLLVNTFEHNTPLHDGAVIIRNNRISAATCYLPLSANTEINKDLGTRHRAAVGISEVSDSVTVVVSEENGSISVAHSGNLYRHLDAEALKKRLIAFKAKPNDAKYRKWFKGGKKK